MARQFFLSFTSSLLLFTKILMMKKMITLTFIAIFSFYLCSAPPLSVEQQKEYVEWVKIEIKRIEIEKQFSLFIEHLGLRESNNEWWVINQIGCMGKWQIAPKTLECLGYGEITPQRFSQDSTIFPEALQRQVLLALLKSNEIALKDYFYYVGLTIDGVEITKSGLLAAAHLGGAGGVKVFLLTMGGINRYDLNKTTIKNYLTEFAGYNI